MTYSNKRQLSGFGGGCAGDVAVFVNLKGAFVDDLLPKVLQLQHCATPTLFECAVQNLVFKVDVVVLISPF